MEGIEDSPRISLARAVASVGQPSTLAPRHRRSRRELLPAWAAPPSIPVATSVLFRMPYVVLLEWAAYGGMYA